MDDNRKRPNYEVSYSPRGEHAQIELPDGNDRAVRERYDGGKYSYYVVSDSEAPRLPDGRHGSSIIIAPQDMKPEDALRNGQRIMPPNGDTSGFIERMERGSRMGLDMQDAVELAQRANNPSEVHWTAHRASRQNVDIEIDNGGDKYRANSVVQGQNHSYYTMVQDGKTSQSVLIVPRGMTPADAMAQNAGKIAESVGHGPQSAANFIERMEQASLNNATAGKYDSKIDSDNVRRAYDTPGNEASARAGHGRRAADVGDNFLQRVGRRFGVVGAAAGATIGAGAAAAGGASASEIARAAVEGTAIGSAGSAAMEGRGFEAALQGVEMTGVGTLATEIIRPVARVFGADVEAGIVESLPGAAMAAGRAIGDAAQQNQRDNEQYQRVMDGVRQIPREQLANMPPEVQQMRQALDQADGAQTRLQQGGLNARERQQLARDMQQGNNRAHDLYHDNDGANPDSALAQAINGRQNPAMAVAAKGLSPEEIAKLRDNFPATLPEGASIEMCALHAAHQTFAQAGNDPAKLRIADRLFADTVNGLDNEQQAGIRMTLLGNLNDAQPHPTSLVGTKNDIPGEVMNASAQMPRPGSGPSGMG